MSSSQELALYLQSVPALKLLPPLDLARFAAHLEAKELDRNETVFKAGDPAQSIYLIQAGQLHLESAEGQVQEIGSGLVGEEKVMGLDHYLYNAVTTTPVKLLKFDAGSIDPFLQKYPNVRQHFALSFVNHALNKSHSLPTDKSKYVAYKPDNDPWKFIGWILCIVIPLLIMQVTGSTDLDVNARMFVAVFVTTILMWIFQLVPDFVPGIFAMLVTIVLGIVPSSVVLSGYASSSFFMAMSVFGLGAVLVASGLIYRTSLYLLKITPRSQAWYNGVLTFVGVLITPVLPSVNGRVQLIALLFQEMVETLGYKKQDKAATQLAVSAFMSVSIFSSIFLTSKSINFVIFGMLPTQVQDGFQWLNWFFYASVAGLVILFLTTATSAFFFRNREKFQFSGDLIDTQLKVLGRMSVLEWEAVVGVVLLIAGVMTSSLHKIDPAWIGLGLLFAFLTFGSLSKIAFRSAVDWPFLMLLGALIGLVKSITYLGLDDYINQHLAWVGGYMQENLYLFVLILAIMISTIRFVVPINVAVVIAATIFLPIAESNGINIWMIGFIILTLSEHFFLPYQCSYYQQFEELVGDHSLYNKSLFLRYNILTWFIRLAAIYASIPFWRFLDIV